MTGIDVQVYQIAQRIFHERLAKVDQVLLKTKLQQFKASRTSQATDQPSSLCVNDDKAYGGYTCDGKFQGNARKHRQMLHERAAEMSTSNDVIDFSAVVDMLSPHYRYY
eukprot:TRINITY_DN6797_c0_g1_i2.p2 TRINITY_DN6797_c0_g1~~TRINITY_DN6797_c0_g1_i2.p2  ORF type:complete len:109 (+),score=21.57 TRINITY_DN6797_c0_g1_i2:355-681(+)